MGKLRPNRDPSAASHSKSPPIRRRNFFLCCFGFSGESKPTDRNLRRRKIRFFKSDSSAVAVQPTGSDHSEIVPPISAGQDATAFESARFQKSKYEGNPDTILEDNDKLEMDDDVASKEHSKFRDPLSMSSSNQLAPPAKPSSLSRSFSLPAPAKKQMKTAFPKNTSRKSYGAGLMIAALTLGVMLVWGRICAIVCVSCFLYVFPLLRDSDSGEEEMCEIEGSDSKLNDVVVDEIGIKKRDRVVLDGFLRRNRRNSFGWKSGGGRSEWQ